MTKIISIILIGLILLPYNYSQQKPFGYKISGNGDIISDVFFIKDGFVLDSANVLNKTYRFEYDENGRLIRDINFILYPTLDSSDSRIRIILLPGYRNYFYNENGDVDSVGTGIWRGTPPEEDTAGYRISYTYDTDGNLLSKIYSSNGEAYRIEENNYDSLGNLILSLVIQYQDTTINIREYDLFNRLTLIKSFRAINPLDNIKQTLY